MTRRFLVVFGLSVFSLCTSSFAQRGDFNGDGQYSCEDASLLQAEMRSAEPNLDFDLSGDGQIDEQDFNAFLSAASAHLGKEIWQSDFDFSGTIDRRDFLYIAGHARTRIPVDGYCQGDSNHDGVVDGFETNDVAIKWLLRYIIWERLKKQKNNVKSW